jgi:hypothetical protein
MPAGGGLLLVVAPFTTAGWQLLVVLALGALSVATGLAGWWWVRRRASTRRRDASRRRARLHRPAPGDVQPATAGIER